MKFIQKSVYEFHIYLLINVNHQLNIVIMRVLKSMRIVMIVIAHGCRRFHTNIKAKQGACVSQPESETDHDRQAKFLLCVTKAMEI